MTDLTLSFLACLTEAWRQVGYRRCESIHLGFLWEYFIYVLGLGAVSPLFLRLHESFEVGWRLGGTNPSSRAAWNLLRYARGLDAASLSFLVSHERFEIGQGLDGVSPLISGRM